MWGPPWSFQKKRPSAHPVARFPDTPETLSHVIKGLHHTQWREMQIFAANYCSSLIMKKLKYKAHVCFESKIKITTIKPLLLFLKNITFPLIHPFSQNPFWLFLCKEITFIIPRRPLVCGIISVTWDEQLTTFKSI